MRTKRAFCGCGCGERVKCKGSSFLRGHLYKKKSNEGTLIVWNKGISRTPQEIENIKKGISEESRQNKSKLMQERWKEGHYDSMYGDTNPSKRPEVALKIGKANSLRIVQQSTKDKISKARTGQPGHPMSKEGRLRTSIRMQDNNPMKDKDVIQRVSETTKEWWRNHPEAKIVVGDRMRGGRYHVPMTQKARKETSDRMKMDNPMYNPKVAKKVSDNMVKAYHEGRRSSPHLHKYGRGKFSDGQTRLYYILDCIGVIYEKEYYLKSTVEGCPNRSGIYMDAAIPELKIDIEYDGYPYHLFKEVQAKDIIRTAWLLKQNWKIIKIIGDEIQNYKLVRSRINNILYDKN